MPPRHLLLILNLLKYLVFPLLHHTLTFHYHLQCPSFHRLKICHSHHPPILPFRNETFKHKSLHYQLLILISNLSFQHLTNFKVIPHSNYRNYTKFKSRTPFTLIRLIPFIQNWPKRMICLPRLIRLSLNLLHFTMSLHLFLLIILFLLIPLICSIFLLQHLF